MSNIIDEEKDLEVKTFSDDESVKNRKKMLLNKIERLVLYKDIGLALVGRNYRYKVEEEFKDIDLVFYSFKEQRFLLIDLNTIEDKQKALEELQTSLKMINIYKKKFYQSPCIGLSISISESTASVSAEYYLEGSYEPLKLSGLSLLNNNSLMSSEEIEKEVIYYELKAKAA